MGWRLFSFPAMLYILLTFIPSECMQIKKKITIVDYMQAVIITIHNTYFCNFKCFSLISLSHGRIETLRILSLASHIAAQTSHVVNRFS